MPEEKDATKWPPSEYALEQLKEMGLINYGQQIEWAVIEKLLDSGPREDWPFRSQYLSLVDLLKNMGYIVTQRGMNDLGVRILSREEMAEVIKDRETAKANDSLRNSLTLSRVPRDGLKEHEVKKLDHWETKTAIVGATSKILLRKRSLPMPEKAVETVKKLSKE
jgi:hypothetical protein